MAEESVSYRLYDLPWTATHEERSFQRLALACLAAGMVASIVVVSLPDPPAPIPERIDVPRRVARFVLEQPPPPAAAAIEPLPAPAAEPEPLPEVEPVESVEPPEPEPEPPKPIDTAELARERANAAGLMAYANDLKSLRDNAALDVLTQAPVTGAVGAPEVDAPAVERALLTARVGSRSTGINTAALSRNTGGTGLAEREVTNVGGFVEGTSIDESLASGERTREEIEQVFDRNKGAIYALYNRALRTNPALRGRVVLRLTIAPDGKVTACEIVSSELGDPDLEQKLVQRTLLLKFDPREVAPITTTKPLEFSPE